MKKILAAHTVHTVWMALLSLRCNLRPSVSFTPIGRSPAAMGRQDSTNRSPCSLEHSRDQSFRDGNTYDSSFRPPASTTACSPLPLETTTTPPPVTPRRTVIHQVLLAGGTWLGTVTTPGAPDAVAWAAETQQWNGAKTADRPVVVLGGGGRTGMEVARALAQQGIYAVTTTRTGADPYRIVKLPPEITTYLTHYPNPVNVVEDSTSQLQASLAEVGASAIIYCASASRQGGTAWQVDDEGVARAATVAKNLGARFILVSALGVDRPDSQGFRMTNSLGGNYNGIMDAKREGEDQVRQILQKTKDYVIVRPGPLMTGKSPKGASGIEVNQGDTIGGGLSRDELAGVAIGGLVSGVKGATVEVYRTNTATALQPEFTLPSGNEQHTTGTYADLFQSVRLDG